MLLIYCYLVKFDVEMCIYLVYYFVELLFRVKEIHRLLAYAGRHNYFFIHSCEGQSLQHIMDEGNVERSLKASLF